MAQGRPGEVFDAGDGGELGRRSPGRRQPGGATARACRQAHLRGDVVKVQLDMRFVAPLGQGG